MLKAGLSRTVLHGDAGAACIDVDQLPRVLGPGLENKSYPTPQQGFLITHSICACFRTRIVSAWHTCLCPLVSTWQAATRKALPRAPCPKGEKGVPTSNFALRVGFHQSSSSGLRVQSHRCAMLGNIAVPRHSCTFLCLSQAKRTLRAAGPNPRHIPVTTPTASQLSCPLYTLISSDGSLGWYPR